MDAFSYLKNCFYESMRLEPPTQVSSAMYFTEDTKLGDYNIRKEEDFFIHLVDCQMNPS